MGFGTKQVKQAEHDQLAAVEEQRRIAGDEPEGQEASARPGRIAAPSSSERAATPQAPGRFATPSAAPTPVPSAAASNAPSMNQAPQLRQPSSPPATGRPGRFAAPAPSATPAPPAIRRVGATPSPAGPVGGHLAPPAAPVATPPARQGSFRAHGVSAEAPQSTYVQPEATSQSHGGYEKRLGLGVYATRRADRLPLRLERYIQAVGDAKNMPPEQIEQAKARAAKNPEACMERFRKLFDEVQAQKRRDYASLEEARNRHPGSFVALFIRAGKEEVCFWPRAQDSSYRLFDGAAFEQVAACLTPFKEPAEVFRQQQSHKVEVADDLFDDPPASTDEPTRPRP